MGTESNRAMLIKKMHDLEARMAEAEVRLDKIEQAQANDRKAIRENKEKGWFAYDKTIELDLRMCDLEEAKDE